jgi:hypothetical protein
MNHDIRRVKDRQLRKRGLKFSFMEHGGQIVYAATRKAAKKAHSHEHNG